MMRLSTLIEVLWSEILLLATRLLKAIFDDVIVFKNYERSMGVATSETGDYSEDNGSESNYDTCSEDNKSDNNISEVHHGANEADDGDDYHDADNDDDNDDDDDEEDDDDNDDDDDDDDDEDDDDDDDDETNKEKKIMKANKEAFRFWSTCQGQKLTYILKLDNVKTFSKFLRHLIYDGHTENLHSSSDDIRLTKEGDMKSCYTAEREVLRYINRKRRGLVSSWGNWYATYPELQHNKGDYSVTQDITLVELASTHGSSQCLAVLLQDEYDPNIYRYSYYNEDCGLPLHRAVENNHVECVRQLLEAGSLVNLPGKEGKTALHIASEKGYTECIQLLMKSPNIIPYLSDEDGNNPVTRLLEKCAHRDVNIRQFSHVLTVLQKEGVKIWTKNAHGLTPLHVFIQSEAISDECQLQPELRAVWYQLADMTPDIDVRAGSQIPIRQERYTRECSAFSCNCCFDLCWDVMKWGPTALAECASMSEPTCNRLVLLLLQANASCSLLSSKDTKHLLKQHREMDELSASIFASLSGKIFSVLEVERYVLLSPFDIALAEQNYECARILTQAGHFVPYTVCFDSFEGFFARGENEALEHFVRILSEGYTLQWWCQRHIRSLLPKGPTRFTKAVNTLPLPPRLKRFLTLQDVELEETVQV